VTEKKFKNKRDRIKAKRGIEKYTKLYEELFPLIDIEAVLDGYGIDYKEYQGNNGTEFMIGCPFPDHEDKHPSFSINKDTGQYRCYVCGDGNFFGFVKVVEGIKTTKEVVSTIKERLGYEEPKDEAEGFDKIKNIMDSFEPPVEKKEKKRDIKDLEEVILPSDTSAEEYLEIANRRVSLESINRWDIKYCEEHRKFGGRLIVPIDFMGKRVSFVARDMHKRAEAWKEMLKKAEEDGMEGDELKSFIDENEFKKVLYPFGAPIGQIFFNWDEAIKHEEVTLCEGVFDAIALVNCGYNAIALLGVHLSPYRASLLMKNFDRIFIALDNDIKIRKSDGKKFNPGQDAAEKIMRSLEDDPDECDEEELSEAYKIARKLFENNTFFNGF